MSKTQQTIYVIGLGVSGIAAARALSELGHRIYVYDDGKEAGDVDLPEAVEFRHYNEVDWRELDSLLLSPGIPTTYPKPHKIVELARQHGVAYTVDIEFFVNLISKANIIAITGTNGKSTTTALIHHILKENGKQAHIGGNIGVAVFDLPIVNQEDQFYVLELSSYQLEIIDKAAFDVGVLLNITPDHIDRHGDMQKYIAAKLNLFRNRKDGFLAVVGDECKNFEIVTEAFENIDASYVNAKTALEITTQIEVAHFGNIQNIVAAIEVVRKYQISDSEILTALKSYKSLPHRLEYLGNIDNVAVYNDSKATNAESTLNALKQFDNICLVLGGVAKEGGIELLFPELSKIKKIYLIGEAKDYFAEQLSSHGYLDFEQGYTLAEVFNQALEFCKEQAEPITFLFSPACASFDMWKNFNERGDNFKQLFEGAK